MRQITQVSSNQAGSELLIVVTYLFFIIYKQTIHNPINHETRNPLSLPLSYFLLCIADLFT